MVQGGGLLFGPQALLPERTPPKIRPLFLLDGQGRQFLPPLPAGNQAGHPIHRVHLQNFYAHPVRFQLVKLRIPSPPGFGAGGNTSQRLAPAPVPA